MNGARPRILFIAEAVTLAHVARAFQMARTLDPVQFDVHVAWDPRYNTLLGSLPANYHPVFTLDSGTFLDRLSRGVPMHDRKTLQRNVADDLALLGDLKPDVVVGDFRISLAASARAAGVTHVAVANAYWSPYAHQDFQFPEYDYPLQNIVGGRIARRLFSVLRPLGFAAHTRPLNQICREHRLTGVGGDIRTMYTYGDYTVYADIPELVTLTNAPATHQHVGAVLWSPATPLPAWWSDLPSKQPMVYVTPGSSGDDQLIERVLEALSRLPVTVIASTAGRTLANKAPENAFVADYLPGDEAAARSVLVICNGGSPTTYQALASGVPVLGLASNNMDQHLNMTAVRKAGAGEVLRARDVDTHAIREAVQRLLTEESYARSARVLAGCHAACRVENRFPAFLEDVLRKKKRGR